MQRPVRRETDQESILNKSTATVSLVISLAILGSASPVFAQAGRIYAVDVVSSEGTEFQDCVRFNDDGSLDIDALPLEMTWRRLKRDK